MGRYKEFGRRSLFITGESYAGKYIPAISAYIIAQHDPDIVLLASAIGNGWVDPYNQFPESVHYSYENNLITKEEANDLDYQMKHC